MTTEKNNNVVNRQPVALPIKKEAEAGGYKDFNNDLEENKTVGELLMSIRDDRAVTKKAIASNIESRRYLQNQNKIMFEAYNNELRNKDITPERRHEILDKMEECRKSSERVDEESRLFEKEQLHHMHELPKIVFGLGAASIGIYLFCSIVKRVA